MERQRLDKFLAQNGGCSRKEAKAMIRAGRVLVDGERAASGEEKVGQGQVVQLDGAVLEGEAHLYLMLNKPAGVLCATRDRDCPTVLDLVPGELRRKGLFPAGRLDKDTEGFVLLTDDGDFAHRMLAPKNRVPKTYHAVLDAPLDLAAASLAFAQGMELAEGEICLPATLRLLEEGERPRVEVVLCEGKYHQVKRMFHRLGREVVSLKRVAIGALPLDPSLEPGQVKKIMHKEREGIC